MGSSWYGATVPAGLLAATASELSVDLAHKTGHTIMNTRGVARNLIWVGINEFVLGQGDKTTT